MAKEKRNEALEISTPSTVKNGKAIRVFIRNPARFSIRAQWLPEIADKLRGSIGKKQEVFANLQEVVSYFNSLGRNIGKAKIESNWEDGQPYVLSCGAILHTSSVGKHKTRETITVEWPADPVSIENADQGKFKNMMMAGTGMTFVNVACFVNFCVGMGINLRNYRALNKALTYYGATYEVNGVAVLTCEPIMGYGTSAKGNKQVTTNTRYKAILAKFEAAKSIGIDVDKIIEASQ